VLNKYLELMSVHILSLIKYIDVQLFLTDTLYCVIACPLI